MLSHRSIPSVSHLPTPPVPPQRRCVLTFCIRPSGQSIPTPHVPVAVPRTHILVKRTETDVNMQEQLANMIIVHHCIWLFDRTSRWFKSVWLKSPDLVQLLLFQNINIKVKIDNKDSVRLNDWMEPPFACFTCVICIYREYRFKSKTHLFLTVSPAAKTNTRKRGRDKTRSFGKKMLQT